jgi:hypothetical protein
MTASLPMLTVGITLGLSVLSAIGLTFSLGPGFLLYLAALGGTALWLLPGLLAQTIPVGLLGGALVSGGQGEPDQRPTMSDAVSVAILGVLLSTYCVGWGVPEAYLETSSAAERVTSQRAVLTEAQRVRRLDLPALLRDATPDAQRELWSRLRLILRAVAAGALAVVLVALPLRVNRSVAWGVVAVAFVLTVSSWAGELPSL